MGKAVKRTAAGKSNNESKDDAGPKLRILFTHPDLGIGGAERLVVDYAMALQDCGHDVTIYTSHHDPSHCFSETKDGSLDVKVRGDFLPRHIFGGLAIVFAILRSLYLACCLLFSNEKPDIIISDQLSVSIPLLRLMGAKILFYCHFPDKLLTTRTSLLKTMYRYPIDAVEEWTTGKADKIVVNSEFTGSVFRKAFSNLQKADLEVLYPAINLSQYDRDVDPSALPGKRFPTMFLSINRFERKKNIALAVQALSCLRSKVSAKEFKNVGLYVAGGYDHRVAENVEYHAELEAFVTAEQLQDHVIFVKSFTEEQRTALLDACTAVVYTPENEHFGIVPVEGA
eukprot:GFYU01019463.1.p1 GENE.GFYU01019463.1~~GFYU01019463.1.p1  ORF type:complete len:341 (+),score=33.70 GFYU01019463.1:49-1071(+)